LSDELGILDKRSHNVSPVSDASDVDTNLKKHNEKIHGVSLVKKIWKLKELQLGQSKNSQKLKLASDILNLKEKEASRNKL
jgi:hypothetical protein